MRPVALIMAAVLTVLSAIAVQAQNQAALIADKITVVGGNQLRAEGHVEVLYQGMRLKASAITYDKARDKITIEGPMSLAQGKDFVVLANSGELSTDFRNGVLESARLVLDQQLQVAATEIRRVDGRYTQLFRAVASTCPVCASSDIPLWQIRASRAVHDAERKRMYYYNALFEVGGLPIFYVPRLRMPDASVDRATGFLVPELSTSTTLGSGIKIPYFIALNPYSDVTLTPFVTGRTRTLGFDYRALQRKGAVAFTGAVSKDDLIPSYTRGYLFARGVYFLPRDYELRFDIEMASDDAYLFDYGISTQDRLRSDVSLTRVRRSTYTSIAASQFRSFRADEQNGTTPSVTGQLDQIHRFTLPLVGGEASYRLQGFGLVRPSTQDVIGRDYARLSAGFDWTRQEVFGPGLLLGAETRLAVDSYGIGQDSTVGNQTNSTATGAVSLSWPQGRRTRNGAHEVLEPKVQLVFSNAQATDVPNEESTLVEFDEGSLFSLDRRPGASAYEIGNRANVGVTWTRYDPAGWSSSVTVGQVFHQSDPTQFDTATGLSGYRSDWLAAARLDLGNGFTAMTRLLLDQELNLNRNDTRFSWTHDAFALDASFLWLTAEPQVGRDQDTWELHADTRFPVARSWRGQADVRYDFVAKRAAAAGMKMIYEGPCITMNFGATRTFTSSASVTPQTQVTISLSVPTAAVASKRPKLQCRG